MQLLVRWTAFCEVGLKSLQTVLHWLVWLWFLSQTSSGDVCIEKKSCSELITPCFCSCKSSIKIILLSVVRVPFVFTVQAWMWSHCYILEKDFNLRWGICSNWLRFWGLERNTDLWISRLPFSVGANALATHFFICSGGWVQNTITTSIRREISFNSKHVRHILTASSWWKKSTALLSVLENFQVLIKDFMWVHGSRFGNVS